MKKLLLLLTIMVILGGCAVYPDSYGYYDSDYDAYPYGYSGPNVYLYYSHINRGYDHYYGHHGYPNGYGWHH